MNAKSQIMDEQHLKRVLMRISHEILEKNKDTENLAIVGIRTRGAYIARRIADNIKEIEGIEVPFGILDITLHRDDLFRMIKQPVVRRTEIDFDITNKSIILVDDVLFSGRTIRSALDGIMEFGRPKKIQLAVLIDRGHRELPIRPDYVGKNVPTSFDEQIQVKIKELDNGEEVTIIPIKPVSD